MLLSILFVVFDTSLPWELSRECWGVRHRIPLKNHPMCICTNIVAPSSLKKKNIPDCAFRIEVNKVSPLMKAMLIATRNVMIP